MTGVVELLGLCLVGAYLLVGCISISPALLTATPTIALPVLTPTATQSYSQSNLPAMVVSTRATPSGTEAATFVKETYPDYSVLAPGAQFVKTWDIKNIGTSTWNANYRLVLDSTAQNDALGSPVKVDFPQDTPPGATVTLSIPLTAPEAPGTYSVYWKLENDRGQTIGVDGERVWVTIVVCKIGKTCSPPSSGNSTSAGGVSATLTKVTPGAKSTTVSFCMSLPSVYYDLGYPSPTLIVDEKTINLSGGTSASPHGCYQFEYPLSAVEFNQAGSIALSIDNVRISPARSPDDDCPSAKATLVAAYPGLDFQCHFTMAGYYTDLKVPDGMTRDQARQIITDAVESAIYGPWILTVKP